MSGREVIFEIRRIGNSAKVTAVDVETGIEATVAGPAYSSDFSLEQAARRKLAYVLAKAGAWPRK
jgi:hypothetical protein